ncbi:MAG: hypothetical protein IJ128_06250 [Firmicutes bacterium]|nr:hypothetical protein [Bacillota bacterium]
MEIRKTKKITGVTAAILVIAALFCFTSLCVAEDSWAAQKENEVHRIVIGSDRHGNETSIGEAMTGMPKDVEYVSLIGDMVGEGSDRQPEFNSSTMLNEVMGVGFDTVGFGEQASDTVSILWADHDENGVDDAGIIFGSGGEGSGLMKTGYNADGSVAYYIYGIAFYEMKDADGAEAAAANFREWIDTIDDPAIPVIVFCHMPLHYARGDNEGAVIWSRALNYAATGTDAQRLDLPVTRDVLFAYGHNHTIETSSKDGKTGEFYIPCGSFMEVGAEEGYWMPVYYTYVTAGYLNSNTAASLISIERDRIQVDKYCRGKVTDMYDVGSKKSGVFATSFMTGGSNKIMRTCARAANPMKVKKTVRTLNYKVVKKKKRTVKPLSVTGQKGALTYVKISGSKKLTVNKKTGKVTVKKGTKKGTYKVKIRITAAGDADYQPKTTVAQVKIRIK